MTPGKQFVLIGRNSPALSGDPPMTQVTLEQPRLQICHMTDNTLHEQRLW